MNRRLKQGINLIFTNLTICYRELIQAKLSTVKQFPFLWELNWHHVFKSFQLLLLSNLMPSLTYFYIETITSDNIKFKQFWYKKKTSWPHIEILMASPLQSSALEEIQSAKKERIYIRFL